MIYFKQTEELVKLWILFQICNIVICQSECSNDGATVLLPSTGISTVKEYHAIKTESSLKLCHYSECREYYSCYKDKIYDDKRDGIYGFYPEFNDHDKCCPAVHGLTYVTGWNTWLTGYNGECLIYPGQLISTVECMRNGTCANCMKKQKMFSLYAWCPPSSWTFGFELVYMDSYCMCV